MSDVSKTTAAPKTITLPLEWRGRDNVQLFAGPFCFGWLLRQRDDLWFACTIDGDDDHPTREAAVAAVERAALALQQS